jgi:hypothetical protein
MLCDLNNIHMTYRKEPQEELHFVCANSHFQPTTHKLTILQIQRMAFQLSILLSQVQVQIYIHSFWLLPNETIFHHNKGSSPSED